MNAALVENNLRLVHSVARKYRGLEQYDDLIGAGNEGLVKAALRYDPASGNRFSTYAVPVIRSEIWRHLRDRSSTIRIPRQVYRQRRKDGEEVTLRPLSLDVPLVDGEDCTGADYIPMQVDFTGSIVEEFIGNLPDHFARTCRMRMAGTSQYAIAEYYGVRQATVSRWLKQIASLLRDYLRDGEHCVDQT